MRIYALVFIFLLALMPEVAMAAPSGLGALGTKLCEIVHAMTGNIGKALATLGVVFVGIGTFFGKASWGLAVTTGIGIAGLFGATRIAEDLVGLSSHSICV